MARVDLLRLAALLSLLPVEERKSDRVLVVDNRRRLAEAKRARKEAKLEALATKAAVPGAAEILRAGARMSRMRPWPVLR